MEAQKEQMASGIAPACHLVFAFRVAKSLSVI
jgi:hypothetical protein